VAVLNPSPDLLLLSKSLNSTVQLICAASKRRNF